MGRTRILDHRAPGIGVKQVVGAARHVEGLSWLPDKVAESVYVKIHGADPS